MAIVTKVVAAVQGLLGAGAEEVAKDSDVIQRQRKFSASTLARTFVFGFLDNPDASDEDLAQMAARCGVEVTPQAVEQRFSIRMVAFLEGLFRRAMGCVVHSQATWAPLLERFTDVLLLDSSTITLPPELAERFPGCGGGWPGRLCVRAAQQQEVVEQLQSTTSIVCRRHPSQPSCRFATRTPSRPGHPRFPGCGGRL